MLERLGSCRLTRATAKPLESSYSKSQARSDPHDRLSESRRQWESPRRTRRYRCAERRKFLFHEQRQSQRCRRSPGRTDASPERTVRKEQVKTGKVHLLFQNVQQHDRSRLDKFIRPILRHSKFIRSQREFCDYLSRTCNGLRLHAGGGDLTFWPSIFSVTYEFY